VTIVTGTIVISIHMLGGGLNHVEAQIAALIFFSTICVATVTASKSCWQLPATLAPGMPQYPKLHEGLPVRECGGLCKSRCTNVTFTDTDNDVNTLIAMGDVLQWWGTDGRCYAKAIRLLVIHTTLGANGRAMTYTVTTSTGQPRSSVAADNAHGLLLELARITKEVNITLDVREPEDEQTAAALCAERAHPEGRQPREGPTRRAALHARLHQLKPPAKYRSVSASLVALKDILGNLSNSNHSARGSNMGSASAAEGQPFAGMHWAELPESLTMFYGADEHHHARQLQRDETETSDVPKLKLQCVADRLQRKQQQVEAFADGLSSHTPSNTASCARFLPPCLSHSYFLAQTLTISAPSHLLALSRSARACARSLSLARSLSRSFSLFLSLARVRARALFLSHPFFNLSVCLSPYLSLALSLASANTHTRMHPSLPCGRTFPLSHALSFPLPTSLFPSIHPSVSPSPFLSLLLFLSPPLFLPLSLSLSPPPHIERNPNAGIALLISLFPSLPPSSPPLLSPPLSLSLTFLHPLPNTPPLDRSLSHTHKRARSVSLVCAL